MCQEHQLANTKKPIISNEVPKLTWEGVCVDFMYLNENNYLQLIDYHSKFIKIRKLNMKTSAADISALK